MAKLEQNVWHNLGDINPRKEGGRFVRRIGDHIEAVQTDQWDVGSYRIQYEEYEREELIAEFKKWQANNSYGPGSYSDWKLYMDMDIEEVVFYLAIDLLNYHGGLVEIETNYWEKLRSYGIHRSSIMGRTKKVG